VAFDSESGKSVVLGVRISGKGWSLPFAGCLVQSALGSCWFSSQLGMLGGCRMGQLGPRVPACVPASQPVSPHPSPKAGMAPTARSNLSGYLCSAWAC